MPAHRAAGEKHDRLTLFVENVYMSFFDVLYALRDFDVSFAKHDASWS